MRNRVSYLIIRETLCGDCNGHGLVTHPSWSKFWNDHDSGGDHDALYELSWFRAEGYDDVPPEEIPCRECSGKGKFEETVTLQMALDDLGVKHA